ncbi:hypothetical protein [Zooshikella sp. RANM57]|uniref:hypothetical protein n=1 Tax=Zooshikella sp. RANM57 TaxID=3425863 RepID=UPI003D6E83D6
MDGSTACSSVIFYTQKSIVRALSNMSRRAIAIVVATFDERGYCMILSTLDQATPESK